ncbi:hypothetical protein PMIN05_007362 [Paraphaeosphaeria minitans]
MAWRGDVFFGFWFLVFRGGGVLRPASFVVNTYIGLYIDAWPTPPCGLQIHRAVPFEETSQRAMTCVCKIDFDSTRLDSSNPQLENCNIESSHVMKIDLLFIMMYI